MYRVVFSWFVLCVVVLVLGGFVAAGVVVAAVGAVE